MKQLWEELWERHRGKTLGVAGGIFLGIVYLFSGFWDMLFFLLLVLVGYYIGNKADRGVMMEDVSRVYRWLTDRWTPFK
jgi:uncharacterized membrane protein